MKLGTRRLVDQALVAKERCLGAVFCSYTFDPAYFEEHVLRSVLQLSGDPNEDAARYHEEARRALQETPVACVVDASVRGGGRRLPYDVHLVRRRTFHPKVYLALYESEARLAVGSGNVTEAGFEQNTELFFSRALRYDAPGDAALLREVDSFLAECASLSGFSGTQLKLVRETLGARLPAVSGGTERDARMVSSFTGSMLDQLNKALEADATITRVGVLAPFFELDDVSAADRDEGMSAVLSELLKLRPAEQVTLDVGVPWDDAPLAAPARESLPSLDAAAGSLWAWRRREEKDGKPVERVEYFTVTGSSAKRVQGSTAGGEACRFERAELERAIAQGRLWPTGKPQVHAPNTILRRLADETAVRLWLHPSTELGPSGRPQRRPLHAKVFLVTVRSRGRTFTHALIGSANASRAALSRSVERGGNVEAGILCRFDGEVTLRDLLPTLVSYSIDGVALLEREGLAAGVDLSAWIENVEHDAAQRSLRVTWKAEGPAPLGAWELRYLDRTLFSGTEVPHAPCVLEDFELDPASAEVSLRAGGGEWGLPIQVKDLAALPINTQLRELGLRELLALLGRRLGSERLAVLRVQRGPVGVATALDAVFGEGFGPIDVFKAWWGAVEDLQQAATVAAFRLRLIGPAGVLTVWQQIRKAPELSADEIWVYGCELHRELSSIELAAGPDHPAKRALLQEATRQLALDLDRLFPSESQQRWLTAVTQFYGVGGRHVQA